MHELSPFIVKKLITISSTIVQAHLNIACKEHIRNLNKVISKREYVHTHIKCLYRHAYVQVCMSKIFRYIINFNKMNDAESLKVSILDHIHFSYSTLVNKSSEII